MVILFSRGYVGSDRVYVGGMNLVAWHTSKSTNVSQIGCYQREIPGHSAILYIFLRQVDLNSAQTQKWIEISPFG